MHIDSDTLYHSEGRRVPSLTNANHTPAAFYIITGSPPAHRQPLLWAWPTRDTSLIPEIRKVPFVKVYLKITFRRFPINLSEWNEYWSEEMQNCVESIFFWTNYTVSHRFYAKGEEKLEGVFIYYLEGYLTFLKLIAFYLCLMIYISNIYSPTRLSSFLCCLCARQFRMVQPLVLFKYLDNLL